MPAKPEFLQDATRTQTMVHYYAERLRSKQWVGRTRPNSALYEYYLLQQRELTRWRNRRLREEREFHWRRDHDILAFC